MKDQVLMAPSGELVVGVPLYRMHHDEAVATLQGHTIALMTDEPVGWLLDCDKFGIAFVGDPVVRKKMEFLGEL